MWVTPDESVEDWNKNGLRISAEKDRDLIHEDYNRNQDLINNMIQDSNWKVVHKCNRGVLFPGKLFHATDKYMKNLVITTAE